MTYRCAVAYIHFTAATWITKSCAHTHRNRRRRRSRRDVATAGVVGRKAATLNVTARRHSPGRATPGRRVILMPRQRGSDSLVQRDAARVLRCGCVATLRQRRSRLGVRVHTDITVAPKPLSSSCDTRPLFRTLRAQSSCIHPLPPHLLLSRSSVPPATHIHSLHSFFRSPSLSVPAGPVTLPPPSRHQVLYIPHHSFPASLAPLHVALRNILLSSFYILLLRPTPPDYVSARSVVLGSERTHLHSSLRFSPSPPSRPCVIKFCLPESFVSQLPLSGLSKFILTPLHSSLALSHRDLLLHLALTYLPALVYRFVLLSRYPPLFSHS